MNRTDQKAAQTAASSPASAALLQKALGLFARGRESEAEAVLKSLIAADPANPFALYRLGVQAAQRGDVAKAEDLFQQALKAAPQATDILIGLALLRLEAGEMDGTLAYAGRAADAAASPATLTRVGTLYREAGQMDAACDTLRRALDMQPGYIPALYGLRPIMTFSEDSREFRQLAELDTREASLPQDERIHLAFTLGKAFMDMGRADEAFARFEKGNRLKKSTIAAFDMGRYEEYVERMTELFTEDTVRKLRGACAGGGRAVFVVGMPRSGSTLVDQIISSHPQATSIGEAKYLNRCIPFYENAEFPGVFSPGQASVSPALMENLSAETLAAIRDKYLGATDRAAKGAGRVVDKMLFNYVWAGFIRLAMPDAKIIHCTRDPRDIGLSLWQLLFPGGMFWAYDQRDIARYYKTYRKIMSHWERLFPGEMLEINYETLVANQERETRRVIEFCGLPWDDACLTFFEAKRQVKTASAAQVRQPIYGGSAGKWKKYQEHLAPLIRELEDGP